MAVAVTVTVTARPARFAAPARAARPPDPSADSPARTAERRAARPAPGALPLEAAPAVGGAPAATRVRHQEVAAGPRRAAPGGERAPRLRGRPVREPWARPCGCSARGVQDAGTRAGALAVGFVEGVRWGVGVPPAPGLGGFGVPAGAGCRGGGCVSLPPGPAGGGRGSDAGTHLAGSAAALGESRGSGRVFEAGRWQQCVYFVYIDL